MTHRVLAPRLRGGKLSAGMTKAGMGARYNRGLWVTATLLARSGESEAGPLVPPPVIAV